MKGILLNFGAHEMEEGIIFLEAMAKLALMNGVPNAENTETEAILCEEVIMLCPKCSAIENCVKPVVYICFECGKIKKFGEWVNSELTLNQIKERYELVLTECDKHPYP